MVGTKWIVKAGRRAALADGGSATGGSIRIVKAARSAALTETGLRPIPGA